MNNIVTMIEGVVITKLKKIDDERGSVLHMMRKDSQIFKTFGEIYFSVAKPKAIKAWHLHKEAFLNYVCVQGEVKLVLFDNRNKSSTKNKIQEIILSTKDYFLVTVPPLIWNGFANITKSEVIIANCCTVPYSDDEIVRKQPDDKEIPYQWKI